MLQKDRNAEWLPSHQRHCVLARQTQIMGQFKTFRGDSVFSTTPEITKIHRLCGPSIHTQNGVPAPSSWLSLFKDKNTLTAP